MDEPELKTQCVRGEHRQPIAKVAPNGDQILGTRITSWDEKGEVVVVEQWSARVRGPQP